MAIKKEPIVLGIQIDADIYEKLGICAKKEMRTKRAIVERALIAYFETSEEFRDGGEK